jgi:hypothetical protein
MQRCCTSRSKHGRRLVRSPVLLLCLILAWCVLGAGGDIFAFGPSYISDKELAAYPIIVVARWEKAPFKSHNEIGPGPYGDWDGVEEFEGFTNLHILRVIKGDIQPGIRRLMVGWGIGWQDDGTDIASYTSTELEGDVKNVTKPNIWFLKPAQSWDKSDTTNYISVNNYREVQPLILEPFYWAVASPQLEKSIRKLLAGDPAIVERTLRYVSGEVWPWPYVDELLADYTSPAERGAVLKDQIASVQSVIARKDLDADLRGKALAVDADIEGKDADAFLRGQLTDKDAGFRAVAVALLAHGKDADSIDAINAAVTGREDPVMACRIIQAISERNDIRLAPALMAFLETGEYSYIKGDELGVPAVKARETLHALTGHWFPFDVDASRHAWMSVEKIADPETMRTKLEEILPSEICPFKAEILGDGGKAVCRITNKSPHPAAIAHLPDDEDEATPTYSDSRGISGPPKSKADFAMLRPGESTEFKVTFDPEFLQAAPSVRKLKFLYLHTGSAWHSKAWIGWLVPEFGAGWSEKPKSENLKKTSPNGNLKAKARDS